jgi:hypothetical protein
MGKKRLSPENTASENHRLLDAELDINHWSYRVPGLTTWFFILGFLALMRWTPTSALEVARIVGFFTLFRLAWTIVSYLVGVARLKRTQQDLDLSNHPIADIHHIVIIPNYKEPIDVMSRTMDALAKGACAPTHMTVVLAMEATDPGAEVTATQLAKLFEDRFKHVFITYHPANLPGEVPGKAANQAWAARYAKARLVDELHMDINRITVTSCDADSIFHPSYFDELGRLFAAEAHPHNRIWQPPILFESNIWRVTSSIRLITYFINCAQLAELANPLAFAMPISSYSMSLRMADDVGYWDPAVVSEDYHMYLRCMFALHGNLKLVPIFLPTCGETVSGENRWVAWKNFYNQQVRHAWGSQDTAYLLQQWGRTPQTPFFSKFSRISKMFLDHNFIAIFPVIFIGGSFLSIFLKGEFILTIAINYAFPLVVVISNGLSFFATMVMWMVEHWRCAKSAEDWRPTVVLSELITWTIMPVLSVVLVGLPILHAQTKMLLASPLVYARTPKGLEYDTTR